MANAKSAVKVSDDEVRKVSDMFKTARGGATGAAKYTDNDVAKLSKALAKAQKGAGLSDNQVAKLVKMFAEAERVVSLSKSQIAKMSAELAAVAEIDKKSWSTLEDVLVPTLGVVTGGAILYGVYKLSSPNEVSAT